MENKLSEQEIQAILEKADHDIEQAAARIKRRALEELGLVLRKGRKPIVSESEAEALLDWMVENMTGIDGMITRDVYSFFEFLCRENGVKNTMTTTAIGLRVQKHGYTIGDKKHTLLKKKVRIFKKI